LPLVLRELDVDVQPSQKIGICGRTGAGKSSLFLTLFRIVEPCSGSITIDGLDISRMGLRDLRRKLSIIPQEPVLFTGTVRFNLSPFSEHQDHVLWSALERAHLKAWVQAQPNGLDTQVSEGGESFRCVGCTAGANLLDLRVEVPCHAATFRAPPLP